MARKKKKDEGGLSSFTRLLDVYQPLMGERISFSLPASRKKKSAAKKKKSEKKSTVKKKKRHSG